EEEAQTLRAEHDALRDEAEARRLELAGLASESRHLREAFAEQLHAEPAEQPDAPPDDLAELQQRLAERKESLERIGPVNLLAAQECTEQEERQTFLTAQRADVVASLDSLKKTNR